MKFLSKVKIGLPTIAITLTIGIFLLPQIFDKFPIPSDNVIGLYHPWRDNIFDNFSAGVPFRNFLLTDPVRQQIPWKLLSIESIKSGNLPLWNPYNFSGTPLLANFQSGVFYPLNVLFFVLPFVTAWSVLIISQFALGGLFMFLYLKSLSIKNNASLLGTIAWISSGFFVAWGEWGNIISTAMWLPLVLFAIEKIYRKGFSKKWSIVFVFSLISSFFAGHLQISFYLILFTSLYIIARFLNSPTRQEVFKRFIILYLLLGIITSVQWLPTLQFIILSARNVDQVNWQRPDWFLPWQNLVQLIAPDFFGNPATLNYWGVFNYGEFVSFIGVTPLLFALFAILFRRDKKTLLFSTSAVLFLSFALPTPWAKIPFLLNFPLVSSAQPSRLIFLVDFCLVTLSALGFDHFQKILGERGHFKKTAINSTVFLLPVLLLWAYVLVKLTNNSVGDKTQTLISKRNLVLPTVIFIISLAPQVVTNLLKEGNRFSSKARNIGINFCLLIMIILASAELARFAYKFTPTTPKSWFFPSTRTTEFLKKNLNNYRFVTTDPRIFPPNFSVMYGLQTIEGYDPLYLLRFGELIAASERGNPDIKPPFGFNRMITPRNYNSKIFDLLGVKFILSLKEENSPKLRKVFQEGETRIYENTNTIPRIFLVGKFIETNDKSESIKLLTDKSIDLKDIAIIEKSENLNFKQHQNWQKGDVTIISYKENQVLLSVNSLTESILILTDVFYPTWRARVDAVETKIYQADYTLRAIIVPRGQHKVTFYLNRLF